MIRNERINNPDNLLVLDDGDFLMGTIYHIMEEYNGFQLPLMKDMGYDIVAIGNHEFDFGPEKLSAILGRSVETGPIPSLLLTNSVFCDDDDNNFCYHYLTTEQVEIIYPITDDPNRWAHFIFVGGSVVRAVGGEILSIATIEISVDDRTRL